MKNVSRIFTTTEKVFGPIHLFRLLLDPGPIKALVPSPTARAWEGGGRTFSPSW